MSLERELARKLLHVSTAVVPVAYAAGLPRVVVGGALAALASVALAVELARRSARGAAHFTRATGALLREHEHGGAWAGATWLLLAFLLAVLAFPRAVAVAAMLGVSLGDAAGAVVGRWWGERRARARRADASRTDAVRTDAVRTDAVREALADAEGPGAGGPPRRHDGAAVGEERHPARARMIADAPTDVSPPVASAVPARPLGIASSSKTWMGTAACAIATTIGTLLVARLGVAESLLAGVLAAAAERPVWRFDDNLRIVLAVGAGILLCRLAFS